jgi:hypothetical protein
MTDKTADKIEQELADGVEDDFGIRAMAQKLAPRSPLHTPVYASSPSSPDSVERSLVEIERLIRKVRELSAEIKGKLG